MRGAGLAASLMLHALLTAAATMIFVERESVPPAEEGLPVEIWTSDQVSALSGPSPPEPVQQQEQAPVAPSAGPIRASKILSGEALAHPLSRKMREMLPRFEEETRLEQLCNIEALAQIAASFAQFRPERIVAYARSDVKIERGVLRAQGAAFRSGREWHGLTFTCELSADRQEIRGFEFSIGDRIPKRLWEQYSLPAPEIDTD